MLGWGILIISPEKEKGRSSWTESGLQTTSSLPRDKKGLWLKITRRKQVVIQEERFLFKNKNFV